MLFDLTHHTTDAGTERLYATCRHCGEEHTMEVSQEGFQKWNEGELIQNALSELSADEREILISGICGKCYDTMFGEGLMLDAAWFV